MKNEEKLDIILDYYNIKNNTIAQKLEVSASLVSQWRNKHSQKLNKLHIYALAKAFNIPLEIFEDQEINSKEELIDKLGCCCNLTHNECVFKRRFPSVLIGKWHCYNYNHNGNLDVDLVEIDRFEVKVYNNRGELRYTGYPLAINNYQTLLVLSRDGEPYSVHVTINNDLVNSDIFYTAASFKSYSNKDAVMFCIFSKKSLDKLTAVDILGDRTKNLLTMSDFIVNNIETFKIDKNKFINRAESIRYSIGKWYLYFDKQASKNQLHIDENLNTSWLKDGNFYRGGELIIDGKAVIIRFDDSKFHGTYFMFSIDNIDIRLIYYIGAKYITGDNIFAVGVMSRAKLEKDDVESILANANNMLNLTAIQSNLSNFLEKNRK